MDAGVGSTEINLNLAVGAGKARIAAVAGVRVDAVGARAAVETRIAKAFIGVDVTIRSLPPGVASAGIGVDKIGTIAIDAGA